MAFPDNLISIFFGPNNWEQRLQPTIKFTSPEGFEFEAKWQRNTRSADKKLGIYFYPKVNGNVVDDLGINSSRMPITIYFDGKNNDIQARAFYDVVVRQRGVWDVIHPSHGFFGLQPISISENIDPTESGNITAVDVEWIEPIDPDTLETERELAGIVDSLSTDLNLSALGQFLAAVTQATAALQNAISITTQGIANVSAAALAPLTTLSSSIFLTQNAIQNGIVDSLNATVIQLQSLGGQVQDLIQFPVLATNDLQSRLDAYANVTDSSLSLLPGGANQLITNSSSPLEIKNNTATVELGLNAALVGFAQIAITSTGIQTRTQALQAAQDIADNFTKVQETLEAVQVALENEAIDEQYFAQSQSYSDAALVTFKAIRYLQQLAFDLKIERRIVLDRPRTPIEIAVNEYKGFGTNDSNLDLFIESNSLSGDDILLLPAGREVVIYV
jgi:hypothetical protein